MTEKTYYFEDQDLYSWSVALVYLREFPEAQLRYSFIDRGNTVYPAGFAEDLMKEVQGLDGLRMTPAGIEALRGYTSKYFPSWYYVFLGGLELVSDEVRFWQNPDGTLSGEIEGPAWRVVFWEQILLSLVSELYHARVSDLSGYSVEAETTEAARRVRWATDLGVRFCDMGTRRRLSRDHHVAVVKAMAEADPERQSFFGTSNLWLASQVPGLKCIGTMSHQYISMVASFYGPVEANKVAMKLWYRTYHGHLGCYLPDCLGTDAFYRNFSREDAKNWESIRIDSGDNLTEFRKARDAYSRLGVDPRTRGIVFSNGLDLPGAACLHAEVNGDMIDTYGIGTKITCDPVSVKVKPLGIVIKAVAVKITPGREWLPCVKLSCDSGKATGDPVIIKAYEALLGVPWRKKYPYETR